MVFTHALPMTNFYNLDTFSVLQTISLLQVGIFFASKLNCESKPA